MHDQRERASRFGKVFTQKTASANVAFLLCPSLGGSHDGL
jgi:hypothetical protein